MIKKQFYFIYTILLMAALLAGCTVTTSPQENPDINDGKYSFSVKAVTAAGPGSISGSSTAGGRYAPGTAITVEALVDGGSTFLGWFDAEVNGTILSKDAIYTFELTKDTGLYARFVTGSYVVQIKDPVLEEAIRMASTPRYTGELTYSHLSTITAFSHFESAANTSISDLSGVEYLTSLNEFTLVSNELTDISPLKALTALKVLNLYSDKLVDISALEALPTLTGLGLGGVKIVDITSLNKLVGLTNISISNTGISDISPLQNLTSLKRLGLSRNKIVDVTPLENLTALTDLDLHNNNIVDIAPLTKLTELTSLSLQNNKVVTLPVMTNLTKMESINLMGNQIVDITNLKDFKVGHWLGIHSNKITDFSPLVNGTGLASGTFLHITDGHNISPEDIAALEAKGIQVI